MTRRLGWFLAGGLLVALLLAGVVSNFASGSPDGLDATARQGCTFGPDDEIIGGTCMLQQEREHQLEGSPLAGYGIRGLGDGALSTGLSGVLGVLVTFGIGAGVFWLARRRPAPGPGGTAGPENGPGRESTTGRQGSADQGSTAGREGSTGQVSTAGQVSTGGRESRAAREAGV